MAKVYIFRVDYFFVRKIYTDIFARRIYDRTNTYPNNKPAC